MDCNSLPFYDVLVLGAGTAGVPAAIQACRAGASVLLVEKSGICGGTTTNGGVNYPGLFHAWGKQIIAGIGWDLVAQSVRECGMGMPDFSVAEPQHHWQQQVRVNGPIYAALCDQALLDAGVEILFHAMPAEVKRDESGWLVSLCTKTGLRPLRAGILVDCSADANLASLAGCELVLTEEKQPATLSCKAVGYDPDSLDAAALNAAAKAAFAAGELEATDAGWNRKSPTPMTWLRQHGVNTNHIHGHDARSSEGKTALELEARASILRLYRFLRQQPGLEGLTIDSISPECGVRETATIRGRESISAEDYVGGKQWAEAVCYSFYPIDLHTSSDSGLDCRRLTNGVVPTVPRGALLPREVDNILVAGRCLSSDRLANSALRIQATCMATGQAAGALAALAVNRSESPGQVPMADLRRLLEEHGAIVPPAVDA